MNLSEQDLELVELARSLVNRREVGWGSVGDVGAALVTENGQVFTGANLDLGCGIGFCAEHTAIANMVSHSVETRIRTIVAWGKDIMYPCGRCREMMQLVDVSNREYTEVIVPGGEKVRLKELLPGNWMPDI